jgi:hypothetical protein
MNLYDYVRMLQETKASPCVLCDNEEYEISESQLQSGNDK